MNTHDGVSCDNCMKSNFTGIRYKCLICYDFDLCENCRRGSYDSTSSPHLASHPMQSILTQADFGMYYCGENISPDNPPAFVCPYCGKLGFTQALLQEHVMKDHANDRSEVICPICAAQPSGEPNLVSDDFALHLQNEHRNQRNDIDGESAASRQMRRRGMRSRNHRTMHLSGGPLTSSGSSNPPNPSSQQQPTLTSNSTRDMDPIAELLTQLSGVRRNAQFLQQVVSSESHLNDIQSKLQMERQRAADIRQQLQRFPLKGQTGGEASSSQNNPSSGNNKTGGAAAAANNNNKRSTNDDSENRRYLLNNLDEISNDEAKKWNETCTDKSLFVQELLMSMFVSDPSQQQQQTTTPNCTTVDSSSTSTS